MHGDLFAIWREGVQLLAWSEHFVTQKHSCALQSAFILHSDMQKGGRWGCRLPTFYTHTPQKCYKYVHILSQAADCIKKIHLTEL